jgi:PAS domain S-box-containing protein
LAAGFDPEFQHNFRVGMKSTGKKDDHAATTSSPAQPPPAHVPQETELNTQQKLDRRTGELAESEARLRAILETAVEAIITIDERGIIESFNRAAEKTFGYTADEVIGRNVSVLMPQPYRREHDGYLQNYTHTGQAKIIGIGREVVAQRKDGSTFPIDLSVSEVRLPGRRLFTGFIRDITERKRAEEALRAGEERYRGLVEMSPDAVVVKRNGRIEFLNSAALKLFGAQSAAQLIGKPLQELFDPACREAVREYVARVSNGETLPLQDEKIIRIDGSVVYVGMAASRFVDTGGSAIQVILRDITERKRAEQQLESLAQTLAEKNKELETIVYVASHDLRSPLVNIQGFSKELASACDTLREKISADGATADKQAGVLLSQEIPEAIQFIQAGVAKIDLLLSGFLRYSRLGRAALRIERLDMNSMLADIARAMEFQIKSAGAKLTIAPLPDCCGDATQIGQVFSNLLDNAVKYLDPKRPGVVSVSGREENGNVIYSVTDNGIGIAPEHQKIAFEIFHRLNPSRGEGEGLGLTIAQRILERNHGKIWVESKPGAGSTFFVSLPAAAK